MIEESDFDVLLNCLPNHLHFEFTRLALEKGKHVLCEKPLTLNFEQAETLARIASQGGLCLSEAFYYRLHPQHQVVQAMLGGPEIGRLAEIEVRYAFHLDESSNNYRLHSTQGGGALYDVGCYGIDCARFYFGEDPLAVRGQSKIHPRLGIDTETEFQLLFSENRTAKIFASINAPRENSCILKTDKATIRLPNAFHVKPQQKVAVELEMKGSTKKTQVTPTADQYALAFDLMAERKRDKNVKIFPLEDGQQNMKTLELIKTSTTKV